MRTKIFLTALTCALILFTSCQKCQPFEGCTKCDTRDTKVLGINGIKENTSDAYDVRNLEVVPDSSRVIDEETQWHFHSVVRVHEYGRSHIPAGDAHAVITLPTGSKVLYARITDRRGVSYCWSQCGAQILADLPRLDEFDAMNTQDTTRDLAIVDVMTSKASDGRSICAAAFSIHAASIHSDGDPTDNYWWWRATCPKDHDGLAPDSFSTGPGPRIQ